jgi:hypothetical protein
MDDEDSTIKTKDNFSNNLITNLKNEWALFWQSFSEDSIDSKTLPRDIVQDLDFEETMEESSEEEISDLKKSLSKNRQEIHKKLEHINKQIDLQTEKLESLRLVGGDASDTLDLIHELNDKGQALSLALEKIDQQMKWMRHNEAE